LRNEFEKKGLVWLQEQIKLRDEEYYNKVDQKNHQRLLRALEICVTTGKAFSSFRTGNKKHRNFKTIKILLNEERKILYEKINQRVDRMMEMGLLKEVESLIPFKKLNSLNTVGYKELFDYLDGKMTFEDAVSQMKQNTRHYAKRQLTWFKKDKDFFVFTPKDLNEIISFLEKKLNESQ
jgi:tRNA dimethylallyltransferase